MICCRCRSFLLTLFPWSRMGSHPQETILHKLLQCESFPWGAVLQEQLQCGFFPTGCSPSRTECSSVGPPWGHKFFQQTCSAVGSSVHGSTGPARSLLQHGLPTGSLASLGIHLLQCGVLHGLQADICSTVDLYGLQGHSLPHHGLLHRLQGYLCSGIWSTSSLSFFTDLGVCRATSLTFFSTLSLAVAAQHFLPVLGYIITEVLPTLQTGSALASGRSAAELAGTGFVQLGVAPAVFSQKPPLQPPATLPCKPNTTGNPFSSPFMRNDREGQTYHI